MTSTPRRPIPRHSAYIDLENKSKSLIKSYDRAIRSRSFVLKKAQKLWNNCTQIEENIFDEITAVLDNAVDIANSILQKIEEYKSMVNYTQSEVREGLNHDPESIIVPFEADIEELTGQSDMLHKTSQVVLKFITKALDRQRDAIEWRNWWTLAEPMFKAQNNKRPTNDSKLSFLFAEPAAQGGHKKSKRKQSKQSKQSKRRKRKPKKKQTKSN